MKIIVDAMSGDKAPQEIVSGTLAAIKLLGVKAVLCGKEEEILPLLEKIPKPVIDEYLEIVNASQVIEMEDDPANAIRSKKDSSMTVALELLRDGAGDAMVSAGNTGALLTGATLIVKRINGIRRAALAPVIPNPKGGFVLIDAGANAQCTVEYLVQFAYMGSYYASDIFDLESARIGLLNIGTEATKGTELQLETYKILESASSAGRLNFVGNVEAKEAMNGACDVLVADGFTGNIVLKALEGTSAFLMGEIKTMFSNNIKTKLSALLVKKNISAIKDRLNPDAVGGTALLGISKPVIKAHGSSNAQAITNAIRQAARAVKADIASRLYESVEYMKF
ncbi:MAG: phosphate acyltransferase PlsX [Oscillospiraceae bacterium]|nr:phosphate acyltransferase PlsX [Oscillospiraceae bacterium]